jgi:hypothetical protein
MMSLPENLADRLARVQPAFDAAPDEDTDRFAPPPDGEYQTLVHEFDFFEGGDPKQAYMKIRFQVVHHPEQAGRFCEIVYTLEDPDRISYLRRDLARLGEDTSRFDLACELTTGALQARLLDTPVLVRVKTGTKINPKTGTPYVSVYVQRRLGDPNRSARRDLERTGASDVPGAAPGEFVHPHQTPYQTPGQTSLDDVPFTGDEPVSEGARNQEAHLRELGCICENPLAVETRLAAGNVDCPIPGHAPF